MSICGNYAKHFWTCALRARDRVCVRCGLPYWDRSEEPELTRRLGIRAPVR
jgi:hypothetical protein